MSDENMNPSSESQMSGFEPPSQLPPNQMPSGQVAHQHSTAVLRPLGVTVVMVLCIIMGVGGLFSGCFATVGLAFGEIFSAMAGAAPDNPQMQLQARLQETNRQMMIPNIIMAILGVVLSGCFLAGGLGLLKAKPWTLKLIRRTMLVAIVFECVRAGTVVWMQMKNGPIMEKFYREMAEKNQGPDMSEMMVFFMWGGIAAWGMWAIIKIGLMIWGRIHLGGESAEKYIAQMNA